VSLRVILADDEPLGRASVRTLLARDPEVELVAECANGMEVVEAVRTHAPQILLLDIQMPGMDGFEVLDALEAAELPVIVFITAFDRYAVEAFDRSAADYVLKPFDDERFERALARAKERAVADASERESAVSRIVESYGATLPARQEEEGGPVARLTIHREGRIDVVETEDLLWVEAADQYVELHTRQGVQLMRESMSHLERVLDPARFLRIHRSALVALTEVRSLERFPGGTGRVRLAGGTTLPVSRSRYRSLKERLA
jgi:two-component system LytT family response regulator